MCNALGCDRSNVNNDSWVRDSEAFVALDDDLMGDDLVNDTVTQTRDLAGEPSTSVDDDEGRDARFVGDGVVEAEADGAGDADESVKDAADIQCSYCSRTVVRPARKVITT